MQRAASFSSEGDQVLARIPNVGGQGVVRAFFEGAVAALDNAFTGLDCGVRAKEFGCDELSCVHGSTQRRRDHFVGDYVVGLEPCGCHSRLFAAKVGQRRIAAALDQLFDVELRLTVAE